MPSIGAPIVRELSPALVSILSVDSLQLLSVQEDIAHSLSYLAGLGSIFYYAGFILAVFGFMAWQMNKVNSYYRGWGKRFCLMGGLFIIIGSNYGGFMRLLYYVVD